MSSSAAAAKRNHDEMAQRVDLPVDLDDVSINSGGGIPDDDDDCFSTQTVDEAQGTDIYGHPEQRPMHEEAIEGSPDAAIARVENLEVAAAADDSNPAADSTNMAAIPPQDNTPKDKDKNLYPGRSIAHPSFMNNKVIIISLDMETGGNGLDQSNFQLKPSKLKSRLLERASPRILPPTSGEIPSSSTSTSSRIMTRSGLSLPYPPMESDQLIPGFRMLTGCALFGSNSVTG